MFCQLLPVLHTDFQQPASGVEPGAVQVLRDHPARAGVDGPLILFAVQSGAGTQAYARRAAHAPVE